MKERTYSLTPLWKNKPDTITALDEACLRGQNDLVQDLLNLCPDLLYTKNEAGEYSLLFVAYSGASYRHTEDLGKTCRIWKKYLQSHNRWENGASQSLQEWTIRYVQIFG